MDEILELAIRRLGASGDGVADGPVYVAGALPGERVRAKRTGKERARLVDVIDASPARVEPPCAHFGSCGGCAVQHLASDAYAEWKTGLVRAALASRGLDGVPVEPLVRIAPATRRRAEFAARRTREGIELGFHEAGGEAIVDIAGCRILVPALAALLPPLRKFLAEALRPDETCDLHATAADNGIDLLVTGRSPDARRRATLAGFAAENRIVRIAWRRSAGDAPEIVAMHEAPRVDVGGVGVAPPPGAFLQAAREAETALAAEAAAALSRAKRVVDLYAGLGTFSFPLAQRVHAVEGDAGASAAMLAAARAAGRAGRITCEARDLARRPLMPEELDDYDAAIFDPPREGAGEQARHLAASAVPLAIGVSCNPATFARDARTLVDGGYELKRVVPVDQFVWTGHVELVATFAKAKKRR
jgi:23S rRNA (uracil1939-C5)-methyltransferase